MILWVGALNESHHAAKFGGFENCGCRDIMVLVCHMFFEDHKTKGSGNLMSRNSPG